ncbi:pantetheine-phosphate adenylyltransferase [Desulfitobacterium sp.]|uniref:pantetheine-phosphate adenylyltransferase n=1 Tax=Desulfitobacterium sp. TaxID=49981 RepID=UPI002D14C598|nr:pantetheine-phosphate adenylyltransferase [Desulfitobacterium sp.]HVJ48669.1 pantetheine-phosphate adenylyltransferase [Desulfitobacterium sp.]
MKTAIYPGTFDPVTNGHLDILARASEIFDEIIMAVAVDSNKTTLFSLEERVALLEEATKDMKGVKVKGFEGLTVELARRCGAKAILRGLRVMADFEYEFQLALMNKKLAPDIETVFLMTKSDFSFISSSSIKWAASLKGSISEFVPPHVEKALLERYPHD